MTSAISRLRKIVTRSGRHRFGEAVGVISLRCLSTRRSQGSSRTQESRIFAAPVVAEGSTALTRGTSSKCSLWGLGLILHLIGIRQRQPSPFPENHVTPAADSVSPPNVKQKRCYLFRAIEASSILACLFHPWKCEKSRAFHASRSPGLLRSQSGRISIDTARRSCQRSTTDGRPQNQ